MKTFVHTNTSMQMLIAASLSSPNTGNNPNVPELENEETN